MTVRAIAKQAGISALKATAPTGTAVRTSNGVKVTPQTADRLDFLAGSYHLLDGKDLPESSLPPTERLRRARAAGMLGSAINEQIITPGYIKDGLKLMQRIDPGFSADRPADSELVAPWCGFAAHPSWAAGRAIKVGESFASLGKMHPLAALKAFKAALPYLDPTGLEDFSMDEVTAKRALKLFVQAWGNVGKIFATMRNLFQEGNQAIYADIGQACFDFNSFVGQTKVVTPEVVLEKFRPEGYAGQPVHAREIYAAAIANVRAGKDAASLHTEDLLPSEKASSGNIAMMALYERAREEFAGVRDMPKSSPERAKKVRLTNDLIKIANAIAAVHEQRDLCNTVMTETQPGEVDRKALMQVFSEFLRQPVPGVSPQWSFRSYIQDFGEMLGHGASVTNYNWADIETRLPAIMQFFSTLYDGKNRPSVWTSPIPDKADVYAAG